MIVDLVLDGIRFVLVVVLFPIWMPLALLGLVYGWIYNGIDRWR